MILRGLPLFTNWGYNMTFMGADYEPLSPFRLKRFMSSPRLPKILTTSLPLEFMCRHIYMHLNMHASLLIVYPLTSRYAIIEYMMLKHVLRK